MPWRYPVSQGAAAPHVAANQTIAACDGDVRAALRALIVAHGVSETEMRELQATVSNGYARGRHSEQKHSEQWLSEQKYLERAPRDRKDWHD
jgi:hypothetical protein